MKAIAITILLIIVAMPIAGAQVNYYADALDDIDIFYLQLKLLLPRFNWTMANLNVTGTLYATNISATNINVTYQNVTGDLDVNGYVNATGGLFDAGVNISDIYLQNGSHATLGYINDTGKITINETTLTGSSPNYITIGDIKIGSSARVNANAGTNDNLVLNAKGTGTTYINFDDGSGGIYFCDGSQNIISNMDKFGRLHLGSSTSPGYTLEVAGDAGIISTLYLFGSVFMDDNSYIYSGDSVDWALGFDTVTGNYVLNNLVGNGLFNISANMSVGGDVTVNGGSSDTELQAYQRADAPAFGLGGVAPITGIRVNGYDDMSSKYINFAIDPYGLSIYNTNSNYMYFAPANTYRVGFSSSGIMTGDFSGIIFGGSSKERAAIRQNNNDFSLVIGLNDDNAGSYQKRQLHITDFNDVNYNWNIPDQPNPTLVIHSANQAQDEYISLTHDGSNGFINASQGYIRVGANNGSNVSLYVDTNVSATGYITRTSIYDKSKGKALDFVRDSDYYIDDNEINHSKFYGGTQYMITDYDNCQKEIYPVYCYNTTVESCVDSVGDGLCFDDIIEVCQLDIPKEKHWVKTQTRTTCGKKLEEGINIEKEIDVLRQSVYELKSELCLYKEYRWC